MARSVSIDPLGFHDMKRGTNSIKITWDNSRTDQAGEKVPPKNTHANPCEPATCSFLALGVWMNMSCEHSMESEKLFLGMGKTGSAANRHCKNLGRIFKDRNEEVEKFVCPKHANSHGFRKGSATHVTSNTTQSAPVPSAAKRGEWSLGGFLTFIGNLVKQETSVLADASLVLIPTALSLKFSHPILNVRMTNMSRKACCCVLVNFRI